MQYCGFSSWPSFQAPKITQPTNGILGIVIALVLPIVVDPAIGIGVPTGIDIEIRTGPNGGGISVFSSINSVSLLGLNVPALTLSLGQTYYIRARYRSNGVAEVWSADVQIGT